MLNSIATFYRASMCPEKSAIRRQCGFTLIELIMVMVMLGVLALFAAPRVFNRNDFEARGFHDQTMATLRFAQKTAVAQRRTVCVAFTATTVTLTRASAEASNNCDTALPGSSGEAALTAPSNVAFMAEPAAFSFDGLGQPLPTSAPPNRTIQVVNAGRAITVEAVTGYVHD